MGTVTTATTNETDITAEDGVVYVTEGVATTFTVEPHEPRKR